MRFVLASASPARRAVLRAAGIDPDVVVSEVDEEALIASLDAPAPGELVRVLAAAKADDVAGKLREAEDDAADTVIVGCDSLLFIGGRLVGKPGTAETARARWKDLAGGTGELLTGHAVVRLRGGNVDIAARAEGTRATTVRFATPSAAELDAYLGSGEPLAVAGGFTLDGLGGWFVEGVDGDPSSVIGISLPLTRRLLAEVGVSVVDLWSGDSPS